MTPKRLAVMALASSGGLVAGWTWLAKWMPPMIQETPIEEFSRRHSWSPALGEPSLVWAGIAGVGFIVIAWWIAGRRSFRHTLTSLAATAFLLLGLWLPVASRLWCSAMVARSDYLDGDFKLAHPLALVAWMVALPVAAAAVITHFEARLSRRVIRIGIGIGLACAIASRYGAQVATTRCVGRMPAVDCPSLVFVSFVHAVLAGGIVACGSLLVSATSGRRHSAETMHGCKRYLACLAIVSIPNLIAIEQSFELVRHLRYARL
jgi:hypothetical protein